MGSLAPSSSSFPLSSSSPSLLLLPKLTPAANDWFITSNSDQILTQALTASASASSSSSSPDICRGVDGEPWPPLVSFEPSENRAFLHIKHSDGFPHLPTQVGSPASSNSICMDMPESPFNTYSSLSAMSNVSMPNPSSESFVTQNYQAPAHGLEGNMSILKPRGGDAGTPSSIASLFSSHAPSFLLSSQVSAGVGVAKISKRRSRTNKKAPIAVLSANTSNFRAMVQQLTGIPTSHAPSHNFWGSPGVPLLKPQPTSRLPYNGGSVDLPTLDTSASFLGPMTTPSAQNFALLQRTSQQSGHPLLSGSLSGPPCNAAELAYLQERSKALLGSGYQPSMINYEALFSSSLSSSSPLPLPLPGLWDAMESGKLSGNLTKGGVKQFLAPNITREGDQPSVRQSLNPFDSSLTFDGDLHHVKQPSYNTVDSWLAFDGGPLASHSPRIDLAKVVS